ncbi:MAG: radical SAM protein [Candidatus Omnitrophica bacterium]|nr:radical SAM protein [Candidatus Omnitrophota bacterium]
MFVIPRFAAPGQFYSYPIGLASVYAFLKRHGVSVSCLNLCHESQNTHVLMKRELAKRHVDMICTGGMTRSWELINDILFSAKRINKDVITVAGGPIVTADPELALRHLPMDYAVIGEGEYTLIELIEAIESRNQPNAVKGLAFRSADGRLIFTEKREEIKDLDILPIPEYKDFGFRDAMGNIKYARQIISLEAFDEVRYAEIIGSRSCPFSCTFCYHPLGKKYRQRSLAHIFAEIDYLYKTFRVNVISFNDELLSVDNDRMLALARLIKPYNIKWTALFRVTNVSRKIMEELVSSGLMLAGFGIESMNDEVLKSMEKHITRAEIINALEICRQVKLECVGNIILGDPADTVATINESIAWWKDNPVYHITMSLIYAAPDAPIYRLAIEKGLIKNKLTHVKNLPMVNLTKMSDRQYYNLVLRVRWWNLMNTYITSGTLIATRRLNERFRNKHFYELRLRCPFCGSEQVHKKFMAIVAPNMVVFCLHCSAWFKISQKQAFPREYSSVVTVLYMSIRLIWAYTMRFSLVRNHHHVFKKIQRLGIVLRSFI